MKTRTFFFVFILYCMNCFGQSSIDLIFDRSVSSFNFLITHEREGAKDDYDKKEYRKLEESIAGSYKIESNERHSLMIQGSPLLIINTPRYPRPTTAQDGQGYKSILSDNCISLKTGKKISFLFCNLSNQDYCHIILYDTGNGSVHEYVITIESTENLLSAKPENVILENPEATHIFRNVSQMNFDEEKGMWEDIEKTNNIIEIKKYTSPSTMYQINKYVFTKTKPVMKMIFVYKNQDAAGNYIYNCVAGQTDVTGEFNEETLQSITLQSSEKLSEMAQGKKGLITTIILNGGITCVICEE